MIFKPIIKKSNTPDTLVISTPGGIKIANFDEKKRRINLRSEARQFVKLSGCSEEDFKEELKTLVAKWIYKNSPFAKMSLKQQSGFYNYKIGILLCLGIIDNIRQKHNKLVSMTGDKSLEIGEAALAKELMEAMKVIGIDNLADVLDDAEELTEVVMKKAREMKIFKKLLGQTN